MRNRTTFVVLLDVFILLFFTVSYFSLQNVPKIWITQENILDNWEGIFVVRPMTGIPDKQEAFIDGSWIEVDAQNYFWSVAVATECNSICERREYSISNIRVAKLYIGGEAGRKLAKVAYNCLANGNCGQLKIRVDGGQVYCGEHPC